MITKILDLINKIITIILVIYALRILYAKKEFENLDENRAKCFKLFEDSFLETVICSKNILSGTWKF